MLSKKAVAQMGIGMGSYYLLKKKIPLVVSYLTTYRCNQSCKYCNSQQMCEDELNTSNAIALIEDMKKSGVLKLGFAGGESLCRDDIADLICCAHDIGLITSISSNGRNIIRYIDVIKKNIDIVQLSLDGREETHDFVRGSGSYRVVMEALKALHENGVKTITNTVITRDNYKDIPFIIELARKYKTKALFQPVFDYALSQEASVINGYKTNAGELYNSVRYLLKEKRNGAPIGNSIEYLKYIYSNRDKNSYSKCFAGKLFCAVDPAGYVIPCCFKMKNDYKNNAIKNGFMSAFQHCTDNENSKCNGCFCNAYVEANLTFKLYMGACMNAIKLS